MRVLCNVYIDMPSVRRVSSREVVALSHALFSARDSVSDLIARTASFWKRAAFDRGTAGRSGVKQTQIEILLRRGAERGEGWQKAGLEIPLTRENWKICRRKGREEGGVIGHFSPTFRSRTRDNAHIFYAHENRGRAGGTERRKD